MQTGAKPRQPLAPTVRIVKKITPPTKARRLDAASTFVTEYEVEIRWEMQDKAAEAEVKAFEVAIQTKNARSF